MSLKAKIKLPVLVKGNPYFMAGNTNFLFSDYLYPLYPHIILNILPQDVDFAMSMQFFLFSPKCLPLQFRKSWEKKIFNNYIFLKFGKKDNTIFLLKVTYCLFQNHNFCLTVMFEIFGNNYKELILRLDP